MTNVSRPFRHFTGAKSKGKLKRFEMVIFSLLYFITGKESKLTVMYIQEMDRCFLMFAFGLLFFMLSPSKHASPPPCWHLHDAKPILVSEAAAVADATNTSSAAVADSCLRQEDYSDS